jgi:uncharacterized protein with FMN-binding domain
LKKGLFTNGKLSIFILFILTFLIYLSYFYFQDTVHYKDGVYYNEAYGYYSDIKVKVIVKNGRLSEIEVISHEEPKILADVVFEKLPPKMIKKNTAYVDGISGATYTSKSLIEAVGKALEQAEEKEE